MKLSRIEYRSTRSLRSIVVRKWLGNESFKFWTNRHFASYEDYSSMKQSINILGSKYPQLGQVSLWPCRTIIPVAVKPFVTLLLGEVSRTSRVMDSAVFHRFAFLQYLWASWFSLSLSCSQQALILHQKCCDIKLHRWRGNHLKILGFPFILSNENCLLHRLFFVDMMLSSNL